MAVGIRCADHVTPLYPQKLALTSPTGGGRSVGVVRSRTKATEFYVIFKKATGDDGVPGDVLKLLGEGGLIIMTKFINNIYETGVAQGLHKITNGS